MLNHLTNWALNRYSYHPEAVIIACYFNPNKSKYRKQNFDRFYNSIKHLNYRIIECVIGNSGTDLTEDEYQYNTNITKVYTESLLWHKESLLNKIISELPKEFKYVFWIDADVSFTNRKWLVEGVEELKNGKNIIQPFEYCVHLEKDQIEPEPEFLTEQKGKINYLSPSERRVWKSFCLNRVFGVNSEKFGYDTGCGHCGFAWGAKREILDKTPLYDKALIGGADHIIAHAAAGHIPHSCITKSFTENILEVENWSWDFYDEVQGKIGYVKGDLYHYWHGDIKDRQYLKRIQDFTPKTKNIIEKDKNGLYVSRDAKTNKYFEDYYRNREISIDLDEMMLYGDFYKIQNIVDDFRANQNGLNDPLLQKLNWEDSPQEKDIQLERETLEQQELRECVEHSDNFS